MKRGAENKRAVWSQCKSPAAEATQGQGSPDAAPQPQMNQPSSYKAASESSKSTLFEDFRSKGIKDINWINGRGQESLG